MPAVVHVLHVGFQLHFQGFAGQVDLHIGQILAALGGFGLRGVGHIRFGLRVGADHGVVQKGFAFAGRERGDALLKIAQRVVHADLAQVHIAQVAHHIGDGDGFAFLHVLAGKLAREFELHIGPRLFDGNADVARTGDGFRFEPAVDEHHHFARVQLGLRHADDLRGLHDFARGNRVIPADFIRAGGGLHKNPHVENGLVRGVLQRERKRHFPGHHQLARGEIAAEHQPGFAGQARRAQQK